MEDCISLAAGFMFSRMGEFPIQENGAPGYDSLEVSSQGLLVQPALGRQRFQLLGLVAGTLGFAAMSRLGIGDGIFGAFASQLFGLFAIVSLVCTIQTALWITRKLTSLQVDTTSVTVYLTGWKPIRLEDADIAKVVIHRTQHCPFCIAIIPTEPDRFRRSLFWLDRFYFKQSQRFVGYGLTYDLHLPVKQLDEFIRILEAVRGSISTTRLVGDSVIPYHGRPPWTSRPDNGASQCRRRRKRRYHIRDRSPGRTEPRNPHAHTRP